MIETDEVVAWVRWVNGRWITHEGMKEAASGYLDHLEVTDPDRLEVSCSRAKRLAEQHGAEEDPKPWFYAGLFSLATVSEAARFLSDHAFTVTAIPRLAEALPELTLPPDAVAPETWEKVGNIREAVSRFDNISSRN